MFSRLLVLGLILGIINIGLPLMVFFRIDFIPLAVHAGMGLFYFLQIFTMPFALCYTYLLYRNLKEIRDYEPFRPYPLKAKIVYFLPAIIGVIPFCLISNFLILKVVMGRDEPPIDDSDLILTKVEIPKEKNAMFELAKLSSKMFAPWRHTPPTLSSKIYGLPEHQEKPQYPSAFEEEEIQGRIGWEELFRAMTKGEKIQTKEANEFLKGNEAVFNVVERASRCSCLQIPSLQNPREVGLDTTFPNFSS